jgi:GntR family transcriptional regulator, rspAB operon transcriptional repressor
MPVAAVTYDFLSSRRISPKSGATARVYEALREAIVSLDLKPAEFIDKQVIASHLGVSRFPVGEALNRLASEGLVDIIPQSGSRVARIRISDARESMFLRRALEVETARKVAIEATASLVEQLDSNLRYQQTAIETGDQLGFHGFDLAFHAMLQDHLGFERVKSATETARLGLDRVRRLLNTKRRLELTLNEHRAIATAIRHRDGDGAAKAMNDHLEAVLAELESFADAHPELFADLTYSGGKTK